MFRAPAIRVLSNQLGWRQNFDTTAFQIDANLVVSESGQYYQDIHALITLDNVKSIAPDFSKITFPTWSSQTTYATGTRVLHGGLTYIAIQDGLNQDPANTPAFWTLFDAFSSWLSDKTQASVIKAVNSILTEKLADKAGKNIVESRPLFLGAGQINNTIPKTGSFVGFELVPIRSKGITVKIDRIGTQFTGAIENLVLYLMHSSQVEPVQTITLVRTKDGSFEWFEPTEEVFLAFDEYDAGGSFYLVYDQEAIVADAIIKDRDWSKRPCSSCSTYDVQTHEAISRYLEVYPFKVTSLDPVEMWDVADNIYTPTHNYGLNLQVSVQCDLTSTILEQKKMFDTIIGLQVATDMIREMAYNPNYNIDRRTQNFSRTELLYELDGDSQGTKKSGLNYQLETAKKAILFDLSKLSKVCLPCRNKGVRYTSV